jgi:hypothetical protein
VPGEPPSEGGTPSTTPAGTWSQVSLRGWSTIEGLGRSSGENKAEEGPPLNLNWGRSWEPSRPGSPGGGRGKGGSNDPSLPGGRYVVGNLLPPPRSETLRWVRWTHNRHQGERPDSLPLFLGHDCCPKKQQASTTGGTGRTLPHSDFLRREMDPQLPSRRDPTPAPLLPYWVPSWAFTPRRQQWDWENVAPTRISSEDPDPRSPPAAVVSQKKEAQHDEFTRGVNRLRREEV